MSKPTHCSTNVQKHTLYTLLVCYRNINLFMIIFLSYVKRYIALMKYEILISIFAGVFLLFEHMV